MAVDRQLKELLQFLPAITQLLILTWLPLLKVPLRECFSSSTRGRRFAGLALRFSAPVLSAAFPLLSEPSQLF